MNPAEQQPRERPPLRRRRALLVLGLLAGLLGMHALAPGGATDRPRHAHAAHMTAEITPVDGCPDDGHRDGRHLRHADATCASGAVNDGPELPAPAAGPVAAAVPARSAGPGPAEAPDGARAPPSLAELQLLRI
ncbi:DUF6153 family protein [Streptomyces sp. NPDC086787]|uniref:DUF6153 family protein n=1 Tax=Streptomyces sp. NPDC086787 TaxID=3365759 RepID=UPI00380848CC